MAAIPSCITAEALAPQQNGTQTIGKDQLLALPRLAVQSAEYLGSVESLNMPAGSIVVRNYVETYEDVEPASGTVDFNKWITFKYGNEGYSNLVAAEVCFKLPKLATTGAFANWIPYVGERLMGDDDNPCRQSHSTETLREYTSTGIHIKRALCQDNEGTSKRAAYTNSVGSATPVLATDNENQWCFVPVHLPWAIDEWEPRQCAPMHAFANEQQLRFKIPELPALVQTDGVPSVASGSLECFLRLHYVTTEKAERAAFANLTLRQPGLTYMTQHIGRETPSSSLVGNTGGNIDIDVKNQCNPFAFMAFVVRSPDDLKVSGATALFQDAYVPARAALGVVVRPEPTRFLCWDTVQVLDGGNRVTPLMGRDYLLNSYDKGMSRYFPGDIVTEIGFFSACFQPCVENQGLGHADFTALNAPKVRIHLPDLGVGDYEHDNINVPGKNERRVDIFYFERNKIHMRNGQMIRVYNVCA